MVRELFAAWIGHVDIEDGRDGRALLIFACAETDNDVEALLANVFKRFDRET